MPDPATLLHTSSDPAEVTRAAMELAAGDDVEGHRALLHALCTAEFLGRLDSEEDYWAAWRYLNVERVMATLADNPTVSVQQLLLVLTQDEVFLDMARRTSSLIRVSAIIESPTDELIRFWRKHFKPDDGYTPVTVTAIVESGHPKALALLEEQITGAGHDPGDKIAWMRCIILEHRNDLPLLQCCERLLSGSLDGKLKAALVDSLFDYDKKWYPPVNRYPAPPPLKSASPKVRTQLKKLAQIALKTVKMTERRRGAIQTTLKKLGK